MDLADMTTEEVPHSYSSVKGHRTRVEREIARLLELLHTQYSATSELHLYDRLEKIEKHTHKLSDIAEYLVSLKYAKTRDHRDEVVDFKEVLDKCSEEVFTVLHNRHAAPVATAPVQAAIPPRVPSKPSSSELRPEKLTHDASTSTFRTWKKQFRVYFDAAQMGALPCSQQQGYLCNCLDSILRARIDREATGTTPVYSPIVGLFTCITILGVIPHSCPPQTIFQRATERGAVSY